jgi:hypothetical protein
MSDGEEPVVVRNKKTAKHVILPPMLINSKLEHVELTEARKDDDTPKTDPETGARIMKACTFFALIMASRSIGKRKMSRIAQVQQTNAAYKALDDDEAMKAQKKENDKVRITSTLLFSAEFYEEAITINDRKSWKELDKGGAGSSKSLLVDIASSFGDVLNDNIYGGVLIVSR